MRIGEILLERKIQRTRIYYHGTCDVFLRSILKNGLMANPSKRTYGDDSVGSDRFAQTVPDAVYLASNKDAALYNSSLTVKKFGGKHLMCKVQVVDNSTEMDEDVFIFAVDEWIRKYDHGLFGKYKNRWLGKYKNPETVNNFIYTMLTRVEMLGGSFNGKKLEGLFRQLYFKIMEFTKSHDLSDIRDDKEYTNIVHNILRAVNPKNNTTIRVPRNIGFSGKTKIIEIYDPKTDEVFYPAQ